MEPQLIMEPPRVGRLRGPCGGGVSAEAAPAAGTERVVLAGLGVAPGAGKVCSLRLPDQAGEWHEARGAHGRRPGATSVGAIAATPCSVCRAQARAPRAADRGFPLPGQPPRRAAGWDYPTSHPPERARMPLTITLP